MRTQAPRLNSSITVAIVGEFYSLELVKSAEDFAEDFAEDLKKTAQKTYTRQFSSREQFLLQFSKTLNPLGDSEIVCLKMRL